jgi:anti-sigma factor RsiW
MAVLTIAVNLAWLHAAQDGRLLDDVVASHVRSTLGQHLVDVESSDHHTVKPWLSSKLDFSPPVAELGIPGSALLGGRVDYLDGHPVAALVYRQGQHVVNAFVWPTSGKDSEPRFAVERGFQTAHWSSAGMTHWVISDVNPQEFQSVVGALRNRAAGH